MTDFKTGDRITVFPINDNIPRYFLAELDGRVYYRSGDGTPGNREAFHAQRSNVSAYAKPYPFKVGDRIKLKNGSLRVYHVMRTGTESVDLAFLDIFGDVQGSSTDPKDGDKWELVDAPPKSFRDAMGRVWRPTGHYSPSGEPYVTCSGNSDNKDTRTSIAARPGRTPFVEVND